MDFPRDAGISCVRHYLEPEVDKAVAAATEEIDPAYGRDAGRLRCICGGNDAWFARTFTSKCVILTCGCNGSSLAVYLGQPPNISMREALAVSCSSQHRSFTVGVAVGYQGQVPPVGSIDSERAIQVAVHGRCRDCDETVRLWSLRLLAPCPIVGDEPWLKSIHGLRR